VLHWSTWSSGFPRAHRTALLEHVEQRFSGSRYSCSTGVTGAHGVAASLEHREQLCWSTWSSGSLGADTVAPLEQMGQPLLHVLQHSCSLCSREAAAPNAPLEHLYLLPESRCSTCYSIAALCAPRKPLLHLLQWSTCICS